MEWVDPHSLIVDDELSSIFSIQPNVLADVTASMRDIGYDDSELITVWSGNNIIVDGHTRVQAAKDVKLSKVAVTYKDFLHKGEAAAYCVKKQRERRNLTPEQMAQSLARSIQIHDRYRPLIASRDDRNGRILPVPEASGTGTNGTNGRSASAKDLAARLGVSTSAVERTRRVLKSDQQEIKEELLAGKTSTNLAYNRVKVIESEDDELISQMEAGVISPEKASLSLRKSTPSTPPTPAAKPADPTIHLQTRRGSIRYSENLDTIALQMSTLTVLDGKFTPERLSDTTPEQRAKWLVDLQYGRTVLTRIISVLKEME